ncbi:Protein kinase, membrane associated tyrosine threonine 1 [Mortierella alpina]|nr:Protein kinase, membrane associated tyrosine threonine 1 [Mortierella alpina]
MQDLTVFSDSITGAEGGALPDQEDIGTPMDLDLDQDSEQHEDVESDTDSTTSTSLPSSFLAGIKSLEHRRLSTSVITTPQGHRNPMLLEGEREAAMPKRRILRAPVRRDDDDDCFSTPTKISGVSASHMRPGFSRTASLLTRMHEKGTLLGKHHQTPSPGEEPGSRTKGFKTLQNHGRPPKLPDFTQHDVSSNNPALFTPIPPPDFGTPPGTPSKASPFSPIMSCQKSSSSPSFPFGASDEDYNPFLGPSKPKARFELDYLSESQWYSEHPHHLTEEYLEELFRLDKRVMFTKTAPGSRDYLKANFYVSETVLGLGQFSDVLKVQSKSSKEFFAVKRLLKTVQGAMERKRYLAEVRNMWRVEKSPNVLQLLEAWEQKGKIYMRLELCKLGSLKSALVAQKKYGGFSESRIWKCLADLASGLRAIHDSNIIHLDIKPENIFITAAGALKIGDFGHSITFPVEVKDITEGDKFYMAMELLNGGCGKYSDIFSLGITVYEMVMNRSGELPGEGQEWHRLREGDIDVDGVVEEAKTETTPCDTPPTESPSSSQSASNVILAAAAPSALDLGASQLTLTKKTSSQRVFSEDLIRLMKAMMHPAYEQRPTATMILTTPPIQRILTRKGDGSISSSSSMRSDEAMSGLLLQSI